MPALNTSPLDKVVRLIGVPKGPVIIDVPIDEDFGLDPRLIPGAIRRSHTSVNQWAPEFRGRSCRHVS